MSQKTFTLIAILTVLPALMVPHLIGAIPAQDAGTTLTTLIKLYPAACLGYAICATLSYRERPVLAWILIVMSLLTSAALILPLC